MAENTFVIYIAWAQCATSLIKGYHSATHVKESLQWDIVEFLDGFLSHERVLSSIEARKKAGIVSLKEEAHTNHCNKVFSQMVATNDKEVTVETLTR